MAVKQSARMEDYLEAIYRLKEEEDVARVSTIGKRLGVRMPTVNSAVNRLAEQGLVEHDRYGDVELTRKGVKIAREVSHRHEMLALFLSRILGVNEKTSQRDACEIEHTLSPVTASRLTSFVEFILKAPRRPEWLGNFNYYYEYGERPRECLEKSEEKQNE